MAQTIANLASVIKDAWTSDRIQKQFYDENPLLDFVKKVPGEVGKMGLQAQVPIHKGRSGGYTSTNAAGGSLNPADSQKTDQAVYTLVYHWFQIGLETAVINQTQGDTAIIAGKDLEMQGAISDVSKQCSRQIASDGTGFIAQCGTTSASTTVNLTPAASGGRGYDAIVRGHLTIGQPIDIGTTADSDSQATGVTIVDLVESPTAPQIIVSSAVTTSSSHYISIANPNSATAPNPELNGFKNIAGATTSLGGINPATTGESFWQPAKVDTATTSFSLDLALDLQRAVFQKTGKYGGHVFTSAKQQANFYSLLQNQVRFTGDTGLGAGGVGGLLGSPDWNGMKVNVLPDIYDPEWYYMSQEALVMIHGAIDKPTWVSDLEGAGGDMRWIQGTTGFGNAVVFPFQLGTQRRNASAAAVGLTA